MDAKFSNCKDDKGRIFVNEYFQITSQNPLEHRLEHTKLYDNIFCYGDASLTLMNEPKNVPAIKETSYIVANNLKALAYGGELQTMPYAVDVLAGVYFSKYSGVTVFNDFAVPNCLTLLAKNYIEGTFM
jgi:NADH dehydrogenase FAD-containing subunit